MNFRIRRASQTNEEKPCEEAFLDKKFYKWHVNIKSVAMLERFIQRYGDIIIYKPMKDEEGICPTIVIYDDYVE